MGRPILAWLLLPVLAFSQFCRRVDHYRIESDQHKDLVYDSYVLADTAFAVLIELELYGQYMRLVEVYSDGKPEKVVQNLFW